MPNGYIPEIIKYIRDLTLEHKNPLGLRGKDCSKWASNLNLPKGGNTVIYTSCMYQIMEFGEVLVETLSKLMGDPTTSLPVKFARLTMKLRMNPVKILSSIKRTKDYGSILVKGVKILRKIGVDFGYLYEDEPYSGTLLYEYGFHDDFGEYANWVYKHLKDHGVREIIVFDPHTADLFRSVYPKFVEDFDLEVTLFIEIVEEAINRGVLKLNPSEATEVVTYHDPCHFSKYLGIIDPPRRVINSVKNVEIREHFHSGEMSVCCGGPIESLYPKLSKLMAKNRVNELLETGARKIIVACPICMANFDRAKNLSTIDFETEDLIEFIYRHLEE